MVKQSRQTKERREKLRVDLINAAEEIVVSDGLKSLSIRKLAKKVECSVGGIYNVFEDLDDIIFAVNSRTLNKLDTRISKKITKSSEPIDILVSFGNIYCDFAFKESRLWSALFEQGMKSDLGVPDWHLEEHKQLIHHIVVVLKRIFPRNNDENLWTFARLLFSSVHGIVSLGMQDLFVSIPQNDIKNQVQVLIRAVISGYDAKTLQ